MFLPLMSGKMPLSRRVHAPLNFLPVSGEETVSLSSSSQHPELALSGRTLPQAPNSMVSLHGVLLSPDTRVSMPRTPLIKTSTLLPPIPLPPRAPSLWSHCHTAHPPARPVTLPISRTLASVPLLHGHCPGVGNNDLAITKSGDLPTGPQHAQPGGGPPQPL